MSIINFDLPFNKLHPKGGKPAAIFRLTCYCIAFILTSIRFAFLGKIAFSNALCKVSNEIIPVYFMNFPSRIIFTIPDILFFSEKNYLSLDINITHSTCVVLGNISTACPLTAL